MANFAMPFMLEDQTGHLASTEFVDINDRLRYNYRCTAQDETQSVYTVFDRTNSYTDTTPLVAVTFTKDNRLGTINTPQGSVPLKSYLAKQSTLGSSKVRNFIASDGQEYRWNWRVKEGHEWTCLNSRNYLVAYYCLGEDGDTSGIRNKPVLVIESVYNTIAPELVATLMVMRHIVAYNV